jgi:hypothetical protein
MERAIYDLLRERRYIFLTELHDMQAKFENELKTIKKENLEENKKAYLSIIKFKKNYINDIDFTNSNFEKYKELYNINNNLNLLNSSIPENKFDSDIQFSNNSRYRTLRTHDDVILYNSKKIKYIRIKSISDLISELEKVDKERKSNKVFFRGHADIHWMKKPSIYREKKILKEFQMVKEMEIRSFDEFSDLKNQFEILTKLQHYGLPTRLLDITSNPLFALYFAVEPEHELTSELLMYLVEQEDIKYFDDPIVESLASISTIPNYNRFDSTYRLYDYILPKDVEKEEIDDHLRMKVLERCCFVRARQNNKRMKNQDGAFILFGFDGSVDQCIDFETFFYKDKKEKKFYLLPEDRIKIKKELKLLGINKGMLFPDIAETTKFVCEDLF